MNGFWKTPLGTESLQILHLTNFNPICSPVEATEPMSWFPDEMVNDIQNILAQIDEYCSPGGRGYTTVASHNATSDPPVATPSGGLDTHPTEPATMRYTTALPTTENVPYVDFPHLDPQRYGFFLFAWQKVLKFEFDGRWVLWNPCCNIYVWPLSVT